MGSAAVRTYQRLGFTTYSLDTAYAVPPAAGVRTRGQLAAGGTAYAVSRL
ncbi:hypothetical protein MAHJHV59_47860 [Mycobacterium avium subsp. hominissuis]